MKQRLFLIIGLILLSACTSADQPVQESREFYDSVFSSASSISSAIIEPYPSEQTVEYFKNMPLSGTNLSIGSALDENSAYAKYYITYLSNGVKVSGTLAIPSSEGKHKLVVLNHGYIDPKIYTNGRGLKREQDALARAGFAVLHTDYRKHAQSDPDPDARDIYDAGLAYAMDSINAVQAVRELNDPRIDASKVGMMGHSMGGGVTMHILVAHPEFIDAAVLYAPVNSDSWENFARWRMDGDDAGPTLEAMKTKEENPEGWAALSQSGYLVDVADPILLFQGFKDKDVPYQWSNQLDNHLRALGKDIQYVTYPNEGHEFATTWPSFIKDTIEFFKAYLE
jgi:uncharacterized protein